MTSTSASKVCVLCGEDCSNKPRIKDSHGNYYCKSCHQEAEHRKAKRDAKPAKKKAPMIDDLSINLDGDHVESNGDDDAPALGDSADASEPPLDESNPAEEMALDPVDEASSPSSNFEIDDDSDYAMRLGDELPGEEPLGDSEDVYTIMTDSKSETQPDADRGDAPLDAFSLLEDMDKGGGDAEADAAAMMDIETPETEPASTSMYVPPSDAVEASRAFWPYVIGVLALIFGGLGITGSTMTLMTNLANRADRGFIPDPVLDNVLMALVVPCLFALLGGWEALAGFMLLLKKSFGARALRYWARIVLICVITAFLARIGMMMFVTNRAADGANAVQQAGMIVAIIAFGILGIIALVWPIILLFWFRREKVKADIESWG